MAKPLGLCPMSHLDLSEFSSQCSKEFHQRFVKFVTSFLLSIDDATHLDVFDVSCYGAKYLKNDICNAASMWIAQAVKHKLKRFQLDWPYSDLDSFYLCESLEELYIIVNNFTDKRPIAPEVYVPNLKSLFLQGAILSVDDMIKLCYGCPMLENLSLKYCKLGTQDDSYGAMKDSSFGAVKHLRMKHCYFFGCLNLSVSAPELEYLSLSIDVHGICIPRIRFNKMHKVTKANINYREKLECDVLRSLVNIEVLELRCHDLMDVLNKALRNSTTFHKLKKLSLGDSCMTCAFGCLSSFLEQTSKLETLTLFHRGGCFEVNGGHGGDSNQHSRENVELFHGKFPKKVEIFCPSFDAMGAVRHFVKRVKRMMTKGLTEVVVVYSIR